jgi:hypothetical protein
MTTELKNLYETLIQDMVIENINGMTPEMNELIKNSPIEQQRAMILTIMEENNPEHRLLCSKIRKVVEGNKTGEIKHIAEVVKMLREYVKVSPTEVKTMGEVMTPIELVEEMLDTLPYEVWTNPTLKWFDPCSGVGTFMSVVVKRLMKGLESFESNAELRYKHIMENMVYVCELQPKNVFLYLYAFDPKDEFALNVYCGSYLDAGFDKHMNLWGVEKFDVIVMNPPYQELKEGNKKSQALWDKFVIKTIGQLVEGGYLVAVHPDNWRNGENKQYNNVRKIILSKQLIYLEIHNKYDGIKTFGASTTYDFYCLHNVQSTMFTKVKCQDGTIERVVLSKMNFISNGMFKMFESLIAKNNEETVNMLYSRSAYGNDKPNMSKEQTEDFKYPCVYLTYSDGSIKKWYSNVKNDVFNVPKVIFTNGISSPFLDENGEYGVMNFGCSIIDEPKNLPFIQKAMLHPDFIKLMSFSDGITGTGHRYNRKVISLFRKDFWKEFLY